MEIVKQIRKVETELEKLKKLVVKLKREQAEYDFISKIEFCSKLRELKYGEGKEVYLECVEVGETSTLTIGNKYKLSMIERHFVVVKGDSGVRNYYNPLYFKICQ